MEEILNYIDGKHAAARQWLEDVDPATGEVFARVASSVPQLAHLRPAEATAWPQLEQTFPVAGVPQFGQVMPVACIGVPAPPWSR